MNDLEKLKNLEDRLVNTETALAALWALIKDDMSARTGKAADVMMEQYFDANSELGAPVNIGSWR